MTQERYTSLLLSHGARCAVDVGKGWHVLQDMEKLNDILKDFAPLQVARRISEGYAFNDRDTADDTRPFDAYSPLFAYDGAGCLVSVDDTQVADYYDRLIGRDAFIDWYKQDAGVA